MYTHPMLLIYLLVTSIALLAHNSPIQHSGSKMEVGKNHVIDKPCGRSKTAKSTNVSNSNIELNG